MNQGTQGEPDATRFDRLTPAEMVKLNQLCDQFESSWQQHQPTKLSNFLTPLSEAERSVALPELVLIDLHYRHRWQMSESTEWYLQQFPSLNRKWLEQQIKVQKAEPLKVNRPQVPSFPWNLGDYLIRGPLGAGGMGQVYRAEHQLMGRNVAIKVLKENRLTDAASRQRFEREVRTLARLSHPNIVTAFDAREDQGVLYLVTELVEGEDLAERVKRKGPLPSLEAMHFVWQAAKGLQYAHSQGIVHRDIKPSNLLLNRKKVVKVLDLGLARLQATETGLNASDPTLTAAGHFVGTVAFMAPEQARSAVMADERSDIYGLGCTLYYLLTGKVPFRGETDLDTILAHLEQPIPSLPQSTLREDSHDPFGLSGLLQRMMAKSPVDRPQSMQEIVEELSGLIKLKQQAAQQNSTLIDPAPQLQFDLDEAGFKPDRLRHATWGDRRALWLATGIGTAACLLLSMVVIPWFWPGQDAESKQAASPNGEAHFDKERGNPSLVNPALNRNREEVGIRFNGRDDYLMVEGFDLELPPRIRIELGVIVDEPQGPANLVTWSGATSFVVFLSERRWGVAYFDGQQSRLMVSQPNIRPGRLQLVAGEWDGQQFRLFVDGESVEIKEIEYALHPSVTGLYIGGVPPGILPADQGTRYFDGTLAAVRVQNDTSSRPAQSLAELRGADRSTVALFSFEEGAVEMSFDRARHDWRSRLMGSSWKP